MFDILHQFLREFLTAVAWLPTVFAGFFALPAGVKCIEWLRDELQNRRVKRDAGKAAALELVPLLMKFARECDRRSWRDEDGYPLCYAKMPKLAFPDNLTWTALPQKTAGAIRALPIEIEDAESGIDFKKEPDQRWYESALTHYFLVSYRATQLAADLRHHFRQGRYTSAGEYDFQSNQRRRHRRLYPGRLRRACDYVWNSWWRRRLKPRLRRVRRVRLQRGAA